MLISFLKLMQEGEFVSASVKKLRKRQMRNFFLSLMVSQVRPSQLNSTIIVFRFLRNLIRPLGISVTYYLITSFAPEFETVSSDFYTADGGAIKI